MDAEMIVMPVRWNKTAMCDDSAEEEHTAENAAVRARTRRSSALL
jgi:hypothetical protein